MTQTITIDSILGGQTPSRYYTAQGQYLKGIAIDPDLPASDATGDVEMSGLIRPTAHADFTGANVNSPPIAIIRNPKNSKIYVVLKNGKLIRYDSDYTNETLIGTVTGGNAEGGFYYNNYVYITGTGASSDDMARYGPLDGTPALTNGVWKGATLGTQVGLNATVMPEFRNALKYPAHWGFVHTNGNAYVVDFKNGQGLLHKVRTTKVTDEGDTNDGSAYGVLDLPFGFIPIAIGNVGDDVAVVASPTTDTTTDQGDAELFLWDPSDTNSFYDRIPLADPLATAIINSNGGLYVFSGLAGGNGHRVSIWLGGRTMKTLKIIPVGSSPMPGGVEAIGDRILWGTFDILETASSPEYYAVVKALGSKNPDVVVPPMHNIIKASCSADGTDGVVTAIRRTQQATYANPTVIVGWKTASDAGVDKKTTTYATSIFRTPLIQIGQNFTIKRIRTPLAGKVTTGVAIQTTAYIDDASSASTDGLTAINPTNYPGEDRVIEQFPNIPGKNNFFLEYRQTGTVQPTIAIPIQIEIEVEDGDDSG